MCAQLSLCNSFTSIQSTGTHTVATGSHSLHLFLRIPHIRSLVANIRYHCTKEQDLFPLKRFQHVNQFIKTLRTGRKKWSPSLLWTMKEIFNPVVTNFCPVSPTMATRCEQCRGETNEWKQANNRWLVKVLSLISESIGANEWE